MSALAVRPSTEDEHPRVRTQGSITLEALTKLLDGDLLALRIPGYCPKELCEQVGSTWTAQILSSDSSQKGIYISDAKPFYNVANHPEAEAEYLATSVDAMHKLRAVFGPGLSPIDRLRLDLDDVWPAGASLMRLNGRPMFFGITRIWQPGAAGLPHQDILRREIPDHPEVIGQISQLGVNIYVQTAREGGELEVWDHVVSDEECQRLGVQGSYGFHRDTIPPSVCMLAPKLGELILVNTTKVHAISATKVGLRVTASGFIASWGAHRPLSFWS